MNYEEMILTKLVGSYRKSRKDLNGSVIKRKTVIRPEKIYPGYHMNSGDYDRISAINETVHELNEKGFISYDLESFSTEIKAIYLNDARITDIEEYLKTKYGYITKDEKLTKLDLIIDRYSKASPVCEKECEKLKEYRKKRIVPKDLDMLDGILKAVSYIENNRVMLYIREASMLIYGDSKYFEKNTLEDVCGLLRKYTDYVPEDGEMSDEILERYDICKGPRQLMIKGDADIRINGRTIEAGGMNDGIIISASEIPRIEEITINAPVFMTIENLTSYLRYKDSNKVTMYLGGYSNRDQRDFLKLVYKYNPGLRYLHFGDIDAGGLRIHRNLCEITGIDIGLCLMSEKELSDQRYEHCLQKLTDNDRIRLENLKVYPEYTQLVDYMLENNCKLEQEIISLYQMLDASGISQ